MSATAPVPAPGSAVPGAPPALRRALTEQDGVLLRPMGSGGADRHRAPLGGEAAQASPGSRPTPGADITAPADRLVHLYLTALGLLSAAVALEVGRRRWHRNELLAPPPTTTP